MANNKLLFLNGPGSEQSEESRRQHFISRCNAHCQALNLEFAYRWADNHEQLATLLITESCNFNAVIIDTGTQLLPANKEDIEEALLSLGTNAPIVIEAHSENIIRYEESAAQPLSAADSGLGLVCGLGLGSHLLAIDAVQQQLAQSLMAAERGPKPISAVVINGPNLNLLGTREPDIYGHDTLAAIAERCTLLGDACDVQLEFLQSNYEGQIVDWIQESINKVDAIIINAGAYTHTSVAIHDALKAYSGFIIELHISNPHLRESFRHTSYVSLAADAIVAGLGVSAYEHCIRLLPSIKQTAN